MDYGNATVYFNMEERLRSWLRRARLRLNMWIQSQIREANSNAIAQTSRKLVGQKRVLGPRGGREAVTWNHSVAELKHYMSGQLLHI